MAVFVFLTVAVCLLAGSSDAIQCFTCQDKAPSCVAGMMTSCSPAAQFCKLEWTATSDLTVQSCATSRDCPATNSITKRQAVGKELVNADGSPVSDINNCCNYDGCNCVGSQCDPIGAPRSARLDILAVVFAFALFFLR